MRYLKHGYYPKMTFFGAICDELRYLTVSDIFPFEIRAFAVGFSRRPYSSTLFESQPIQFGMEVPLRTFAIRRIMPAIAQALTVNKHCDWCTEPPTYFVFYRIPPRGARRFKLACVEHAQEASAQTGLRLEE